MPRAERHFDRVRPARQTYRTAMSMPMPPYPVICYAPGCCNEAAFKVAARWSDGITGELKTYSLACSTCLPALFASARAKRAACRLAPGETLEEPEIYELHRGHRDRELPHRADLEPGKNV